MFKETDRVIRITVQRNTVAPVAAASFQETPQEIEVPGMRPAAKDMDLRGNGFEGCVGDAVDLNQFVHLVSPFADRPGFIPDFDMRGTLAEELLGYIGEKLGVGFHVLRGIPSEIGPLGPRTQPDRNAKEGKVPALPFGWQARRHTSHNGRLDGPQIDRRPIKRATSLPGEAVL